MAEVLQEQLVSLVDQLGRVIPEGKPRVVCAHMIPVLGLKCQGFGYPPARAASGGLGEAS